MKYLTIEHLEKLDEIKLNKYLQECVDKLEKINYEDAFEEKKENYHKFVEHVYKVAKEHNLNNKKTIFSLMLLWHVEGDTINKDEEFVDTLQSKELSNHEKSEYFLKRTYVKMEERK